MHLDCNAIAERLQAGFEAGQTDGRARIDQTRRLPVIDPQTAGKIGNGHVSRAQRAVKSRFQRHRRIWRYQVVPGRSRLGAGDVFIIDHASGERRRKTIGSLSERLRHISAVGQRLGQVRKMNDEAPFLVRFGSSRAG